MKTKRLKRYLTKRVVITYHHEKFEVVDDKPTRTEGFGKCELRFHTKGRLSMSDLLSIEEHIRDHGNYSYVDIISYNVVN